MVVYAIVVLYNPDEEQILNNISLISQGVQKCIVVVNACDEFTLQKLSFLEGVKILINSFNIGLSKSINRGVRMAIEENAEAVLLFDQDSIPSTDFFTSLYHCYHELDKKNIRIGAIGANSNDIKNINYGILEEEIVKQTNFVITSGCLIPIKALKEVGLMDETFFIDYIDYEWCFRALSKKYKIFVSTQSLLMHNLGDQIVSFFNVKKPIHNNVIRHYHIIRNQLIILTRDYIPIKWRGIHFLKLFYRIPGYIFYSSDRKNSLKNILQAFKDFYKLKNKTKFHY